MKKNVMKKWLAVSAAACLSLGAVACGSTETAEAPVQEVTEAVEATTTEVTEAVEETTTEVTEAVEDALTLSITVEVVDNEGATESVTFDTTEEFLYDAIVADGEITLDASETEYGLYVDGVNGVVADYSADGAYWAIYVDGEYGQYGIDTQPVEDGVVYTLQYETYTE